MKKIIATASCIIMLGVSTFTAQAQVSPNAKPLGMDNPWSPNELMEPAELAAATTKPLIFNIGVVEDIKGAKHIGAASSAENLAKFKKEITGLPKNTTIVFYCGCCPFTKCPNIRPAFRELKAAGFTNIKLLNLSTNLKTDWIAKGYAVAE